jgi:hypothetical protein
MGRKNSIKSVMMWAYEFPILTGRGRHFPAIVLSHTAWSGMQSMKDVMKTQVLQAVTIASTMLLQMRAHPRQRKRRYSSRMDNLLQERLVA